MDKLLESHYNEINKLHRQLTDETQKLEASRSRERKANDDLEQCRQALEMQQNFNSSGYHENDGRQDQLDSFKEKEHNWLIERENYENEIARLRAQLLKTARENHMKDERMIASQAKDGMSDRKRDIEIGRGSDRVVHWKEEEESDVVTRGRTPTRELIDEARHFIETEATPAIERAQKERPDWSRREERGDEPPRDPRAGLRQRAGREDSETPLMNVSSAQRMTQLDRQAERPERMVDTRWDRQEQEPTSKHQDHWHEWSSPLPIHSSSQFPLRTRFDAQTMSPNRSSDPSTSFLLSDSSLSPHNTRSSPSHPFNHSHRPNSIYTHHSSTPSDILLHSEPSFDLPLNPLADPYFIPSPSLTTATVTPLHSELPPSSISSSSYITPSRRKQDEGRKVPSGIPGQSRAKPKTKRTGLPPKGTVRRQ
ncbi:hypothetical protein BLNAU_7633 [Blattamonas nauphoetae]|uniref:Uncharacterized protein n=1 Tax=Blattamonas nauphoetae TaxID=2049346 RepID=A0ABQ9Y161_9EUKA|nr:hypothetical protein BLNAU_7633 [Blattamonas nauphoetae]